MNDWILPALELTPRELLWGQWEMLGEKPKTRSERETTDKDVIHHFAFADMLRSQGYTEALAEAARRKACFDNKVHPVEFNKGDLVQVYNSKMDMMYETRVKLLPRWSPPRIITDCLLNSYILCRLDGTELQGTTRCSHLCR